MLEKQKEMLFKKLNKHFKAKHVLSFSDENKEWKGEDRIGSWWKKQTMSKAGPFYNLSIHAQKNHTYFWGKLKLGYDDKNNFIFSTIR